MNILGGIDGSERAYHALEFAAQLADAKRDQFVLYCSPRKVVDTDVVVLGAGVPERLRQSFADLLLEAAKHRLPEGFQARAAMVVGDAKPIDGILATAEQSDAGLIVVGAHGATVRRPLFPGGVARGVAHRAEVPVLMVRETSTTRQPGPLRVMMAHCRTPACHAAIETLQRFHWPDDAVGTVLHVVDALDPSYVEALERNHGPASLDVPGMLNEYRRHVAEDKQRALAHLRAAQASLPPLFRKTEPIVAEGQNVEQIMTAVEQGAIDLLVVGARSLTALTRLLSSTTESLMLHCPCSMLIVHARPARAES